MSDKYPAATRLRFNLGFMLEAQMGTSRVYELDYPKIHISDDVTLAPLTGSFEVTRTSEGVYAQGKLHSRILATCVRCLADTAVDITLELDDLFYYPPHLAPEGEYTFGEDGFIDLAPLVRELSVLALPSTPLCKPDCQGLCQECGANLNETDCGCKSDSIDPRFAALRDLLN